MMQEVPRSAWPSVLSPAVAAIMAGCHFSIMVRGMSQVFALARRCQAFVVSRRKQGDLGGYKIHSRASGLIDNDAEDE
jgi:acetyl-CoA carboxylase carboxyltransferase component